MVTRFDERRSQTRIGNAIAMAKEIVNRVANSVLVTFDLETYYPSGERRKLDISQWLDQGIVLREKEFRTALSEFDFSSYQNSFVAMYCSTDALLPAWASLLVASHLHSFAKKIIWGSLEELEVAIFQDIIQGLDIAPFIDKPVIIKGCSDKNIPDSAYIALVERLQPHVKKLMYGEACSFVPLFKK